MAELDIVISKIIEYGCSEEKETCWLKCRLNNGCLVAFWGELLTGNNRNIASIRHQRLPIRVSILDPEYCAPTNHERKDFGLYLSIPATVQILIDSEF
jgi:hypothetical protein